MSTHSSEVITRQDVDQACKVGSDKFIAIGLGLSVLGTIVSISGYIGSIGLRERAELAHYGDTLSKIFITVGVASVTTLMGLGLKIARSAYVFREIERKNEASSPRVGE